MIIAQTAAQDVRFPLVYQILCIVLTALFVLTFSISRNPRSWRRFYQAKFHKGHDALSVNRNKRIDEMLKRYGIIVAMSILVLDVTCFVLGVTYRHRLEQREKTLEEQFHKSDIERFKAGRPPGQVF